MKTDRPSLRQVLLGWLFLPIVLLAGVWAWSSYGVVLHFANRVYDWELGDSVLSLARQVDSTAPGRGIDLPRAVGRMIEFDQYDRVYYSISDPSGRLFAGNADLPIHPGVGNAGTVRFYDDLIDGRPVRLAEYRQAGPGGTLYVRVAETLNKRRSLAREVMFFMALPQLMFILLIALLVWVGIGRAVAPFRRIRDAIQQRNPRDLTPIDDRHLPAEAYEQVNVINALMARLGQVLALQKEFIADATHQLRTPVTVLRTQTELALKTNSPGDLHTLVQGMDRATARLSRLTNQLLNLARAEAGLQGLVESAAVSVTDVVEEVSAALAPAALAKEIGIHVHVPPGDAMVNGDRRMLEEMVSNVVDNAILYTPFGGRVDITVSCADSGVALVVADNGPGIPEAEREMVFRRFYRGEHALAEGSGLGLAIAHEIAVLHKGGITLSEGRGGAGLAVRIEMPALSAEPD
ncbi:MAG TPA: sensor histidine kinase [Parasulfuritortus sp.]